MHKSLCRPVQLSKQGILLEAAIEAAATAVVNLKDPLNECDSKVGDGDCGSTMYRGATAILEDMKKYYPLNDAAETVNEMRSSISRVMGGTSGIIYTILCKAAYACLKAKAQPDVSPNQWAEALEASTTAVSKYGGAVADFRTLLDALIPASQVLQQKLKVGEDPVTAFVLSYEAALAGAESTKLMRAQARRSSYVSPEIVASVPDPGAMAAAAWYRATTSAIRNTLESFLPPSAP